MIAQLVLCAFCFALGGVSRFCFVGVTAVENRLKNKFSTFMLDLGWAIFTVAALMCVIFVFNNGITKPYMLISALLGFCIIAIFV
ncbi:MAG: hypothetical protein E7350_04565 [Clostridiales bacterium]|nr:hypothetical protein [Clostridiales bacterium]